MSKFSLQSYLLLSLFVLVLLVCEVQSIKHPFPKPRKIVYKGGKNDFLQISKTNFRFSLLQSGKSGSYMNLYNKDILLVPYLEMIDFLEQHTVFVSGQQNQEAQKINVHLKVLDSPEDYKQVEGVVESYEIEISQEGKIDLFCHGYVSFVRALNIFYQLIQDGQISHYPISIQDSPTYSYRGLMIDTSRTFLPVDRISKLLKGMQKAALNVLHWHITDSESFPLQLSNFTEIPNYGAYQTDQVYTQSQVQALIAEASSRGIVIIPEADTPGHARSWALAPNLQQINSCFGYPPKDWELYCAEPPCGQLDPTLELTYTVVQSVLGQISKQYPANYFHFGGDEVNKGCWDFNPNIKVWMNANNISDYSQLQNYYQNKIRPYVNSSKRGIYWFDTSQVSLQYPNNSIIQFWGSESQIQLLKNFTNDVILSPYDQLYFDCGVGNHLGGDSWCDPFKTWKSVYNYKPSSSGIGKRVLGAEATLWSEMIWPQNFDWRVWPRASAMALRLWNEEEELPITELVQSLQYNIDQLYDLGLKPGPVTDQFCYKNIEMCFFDNPSEQKEIPEQIRKKTSKEFLEQ